MLGGCGGNNLWSQRSRRGAFIRALLRLLPLLIGRVRFFLRRHVRRNGGGLRRSRLPDILHELLALLPQDALDAADGVALAIKQMTDAAQKIDVLGAIEASASASLHWPDLVKATFPESQHVLGHGELGGDF